MSAASICRVEIPFSLDFPQHMIDHILTSEVKRRNIPPAVVPEVITDERFGRKSYIYRWVGITDLPKPSDVGSAGAQWNNCTVLSDNQIVIPGLGYVSDTQAEEMALDLLAAVVRVRCFETDPT